MEIKLTKALPLLLLISFFSNATVYKCKINGVVTFSQTPCGKDSETTDYKMSETNRTAVENIASELTKKNKISDDGESVDKYLKISRIKRNLSKLEWKKKDLIASRDEELRELKNTKAYAANNLAGASFLQSLAQEMSSIADTYAVDIQSVDREISELRAELRTLEN